MDLFQDSLNEIEEIFEDLTNQIQSLEFTKNIHDEHEGYILKALSWIQSQQNLDGTWGLGSMIDIILALQATGIWTPNSKEWLTKVGNPGGVALSFGWLEESQKNGCWDNNLWDTAAIIQTACILGEHNRPMVGRGVEWLISRSKDNWGLDKRLGLHYISQSLMALVMADAPADIIKDCRGVLIQRVRASELDNFHTPYIWGQVLEALIVGGVNPADKLIQPISNYLKDYLTKVDVSIANFMHICASFKGLGISLGASNLDEPAMQITLGKMFHPTRIRDDGSWYRDITMTGWALVSMKNLKSVRKIESYPYQLYNMVEDSRGKVENYVTARLILKRSLLFNSIVFTLLAMISILAIYFNVYYGFSPLGNSNFLYLVIGLFISGTLYFGRKIFY